MLDHASWRHALTLSALSCFSVAPLAARADAPPAAQATQPAAEAPAEANDELAKLQAENERLRLEYEIAQQRQANALLQLSLETKRLEAEAALRQSEADTELSQLRAEIEKLQVQRQLESVRHEAELAELGRKQAAVSAQNALKTEQLKAASLEVLAEQADLEAKLAAVQSRLQIREADDQWRDVVKEEIEYRDQPLVDGTLYISDRRIDMDGPIITGTADYVCERIDYFNNQSPEKPIFIVIDNCPGGSVMQGYRIVKAMEASRAPVHVVVRSFAASMAAVITTLADHSYAYPNAILLHHQMSAGTSGNMTDMEQEVETLREWERRLAEPVAAKMGLTLEEFKTRMYDAKRSGDWDEFADEAQKLGWVQHVIDQIYDESIRHRPTGEAPKPWYYTLLMKDENGRSYVNLPPLEPMDAYLMYNPNRFFRVDGQ